MSEKKVVNPKGNWFQRFASKASNIPMFGPVLGVGAAVPWALSEANKAHTGTDTMVQGGINIAKDRPGGLMRGVAGTADWFGDLTGQTWDFDRQGQWFGNYGKGNDDGIGSVADNYEVIAGSSVLKPGAVLENPLGPEGGVAISKDQAKKKEEEKEKEEMDLWQTKLKETEAAGNRLADRNLIRKNIAALPALMAAGNLGVAEAAKGHAEQTVKAMAHIPKLQLAAMSYQPMINYSLGR